MPSKAPDFDKELDTILAQLKPSKKSCQQCGENFDILQEDIALYKRLWVPPPKLCPGCRKQRRFGFYNNILKFYKKQCQVHKDEKAISVFRPESPYKIFDLKYWWSDKWGGEEYTRDYNPSKSFFEQFQALNLTIPHPAISHYWKGVVNSPYTISIIYSKNCYLSSVATGLDNVHYSYWVAYCRDCLDLLNVGDCENCYELVSSGDCYNCYFCQESAQCLDSYFLYNCRNCQNCFACTHLRHKSYCFFNEQLTKEEYKAKISQINLGHRGVLEEYKEKFEKLLKKTIRRNLSNDRKSIDCLGDQLWQAKDCHQVFRADVEIDNVRYSDDITDNIKDSMELWIVGPNIALSYEVIEAFNSSNIKFSYFIRDGLGLEYCFECHNCQNCFGCIGLRNKSYHIFNKQYNKEEYYQLLDKIKTKMLKDGEYGEFFPLSQALQPYNDTYAMVEFPLSKQEVLKNGWPWYDEPEIPVDLKGLELVKIKDLPKDIKDVGDDILDKAIVCEITKKPFRLIKSELEFYRKHNLAIPTKHPHQRILERLQRRNPSKIWPVRCAKCHQAIYTSYPPKKQKELKIYCDKCYLKEIW